MTHERQKQLIVEQQEGSADPQADYDKLAGAIGLRLYAFRDKHHDPEYPEKPIFYGYEIGTRQIDVISRRQDEVTVQIASTEDNRRSAYRFTSLGDKSVLVLDIYDDPKSDVATASYQYTRASDAITPLRTMYEYIGHTLELESPGY